MSAVRGRDILVALSLANLCYVRIWGSLLNPGNQYFLLRPPSWVAPVVACAGTLGAAVLFWAGAQMARHRGPQVRRLAALVFLGALALGANALRQQVPALSYEALVSTLGRGTLVGVVALGVLALAAAGIRWGPERLAFGLSRVVLVLVPFAFLTFGQAALVAFRSFTSPAAFKDKTPLPIGASEPDARRVLFLVFDGLDQQLLTSERAPDVALPMLDEFRAASVVWDNAYPPSNNTGVSLPALITGRDVIRVRRAAANELLLSYSGSEEPKRWSEETTIFTRVHALGRSAALVGWYHPYGRVLGQQVSRCRWFPYCPDPPNTLKENVLSQAALVVDTIPGAYRFQMLERIGAGSLRGSADPAWHARQYEGLHAEVLKCAADDRLALVFAHYPIPHMPFIFNRRSGEIDVVRQNDYFDNLALVDRTLRDLRDALKRAHLADCTAVLITSDHWHRRAGWRDRGELSPVIGNTKMRVPLMLRLPGQTTGVVRPERLRSHASHDLSIAVLTGRLSSVEDVDAVMRSLPQWMTP